MSRLLRLPDVLALTALSRSKLYVYMGDGTFPKPVKIGARANAWPENEIADWINSRVERREAA